MNPFSFPPNAQPPAAGAVPSNDVPELPPLGSVSSENYRSASQSASCEAYAMTPAAEHYAAIHGVPLEAAYRAIDPNAAENGWLRIQMPENDSQPGDVICADNIVITTNSLQMGTYYDTLSLATINDKPSGEATYAGSTCKFMKHSGDEKPMPNYLRHTISIDGGAFKKDPTASIAVASAGWLSGNPDPLINYIDKQPVLEIRTTDIAPDGSKIMKRYIAVQPLEQAEKNTAIISAIIRPTADGKLAATITSIFTDGFAGNTRPIRATFDRIRGTQAAATPAAEPMVEQSEASQTAVPMVEQPEVAQSAEPPVAQTAEPMVEQPEAAQD